MEQNLSYKTPVDFTALNKTLYFLFYIITIFTLFQNMQNSWFLWLFSIYIK